MSQSKFGSFFQKIFEALFRRNTSNSSQSDSSSSESLPGSSNSPSSPLKSKPLAWGKKVSPAFRARVIEIAEEMGAQPDHLMACMAFETGETFSPTVRNAAGSGAIGLIQFMPATLKGMGRTVEQLKVMTAEQQLEVVREYFKPYRGRVKNLSSLYMAILWPAAVSAPEGNALWTKESRPTTYAQNAGLDANKDGIITKAEAAAKVQDKLDKGLTAAFRSEGV